MRTKRIKKILPPNLLRKADFKDYSRMIVRYGHRRPVHVGNRFHQRQAKSVARTVSAFLTPKKSTEDTLMIVLMKAGSIISHP